MVVKHRY